MGSSAFEVSLLLLDTSVHATRDDAAAAVSAAAALSNQNKHPAFISIHVPSPSCRLIGVIDTPISSQSSPRWTFSIAASAAAAAGATLVNDGSSPWAPIGNSSISSSSSIRADAGGASTLLHVTLQCYPPYPTSAVFQ